MNATTPKTNCITDRPNLDNLVALCEECKRPAGPVVAGDPKVWHMSCLLPIIRKMNEQAKKEREADVRKKLA